jgi:prepilin-type N-terminal cleavage/methylation domain-containing protein
MYSAMEANPKKTERKAGFTLTEAMVALSVSVLLSAGILRTYLFCGKTVHRRVGFNVNLSQARYFTEFFGKQVNESQRSMLSLDSGGNQLFLTVPGASNVWESAAFQYRPASNDLVFTRNGGSRILLGETTLPEDGAAAFSILNGVVRCRLRVGEDENLSVALNTAARPRNP